MKKVFLLGLAIVLFTSCEQKNDRYTQNSPEIDKVKSMISSYNDQDWDTYTSNYADTSKTFFNTPDPIPSKDVSGYHKANDANYSSRAFDEEGQTYEMVTTDEGETWVNFWGTWRGTLAGNDKEYTIAIHTTTQFKNGEIVEEYGVWDSSLIVLALQEIETANKTPERDQKILATHKKFLEVWNKKESTDQDLFNSISVPDMVRYQNGIKQTNDQSGYLALLGQFHDAFPDIQFTDVSVHVRDGKVYNHWICNATNTGNFGENPATGKVIKTEGLTVTSYDNEGRLIREDSFYDMLDLYQQIGHTLTPPKS